MVREKHNFTCEKCGKCFNRLDSYKRHQNKKLDCSINRSQCIHCKKILSSSSAARKHEKICKSSNNTQLDNQINQPTINGNENKMINDIKNISNNSNNTNNTNCDNTTINNINIDNINPLIVFQFGKEIDDKKSHEKIKKIFKKCLQNVIDQK